MRFRLYPTLAQETELLRHCQHARFVWNLAVEQSGWWRPYRGPAPGYAAQNRQLTEARQAIAWLAAGSVTVQQQALRDFRQAMANFFAGTHRRPTWRKAGRDEGFRTVGPRARRVEKLSRKWSSVRIPKVGWVKIRRSRAIPSADSYRVTRDRSGRWHIAFASIPDPKPAPCTGEIVGVDRGVTVSATTSTGEMLHCPGLRPKEHERLRRLQQRAARQQVRGYKKSNRLRATYVAIARLKAREADRRKDWVEKTTTSLAYSFDVICVEDLPVKKMTRSARGTSEKPGTNVQQKAGLNRRILNSGWTMLVTRLEHKAPGRVEKINFAYTSQRCSMCGHVAAESRKSQAAFRCVSCAYKGNADVNAARNIAAGRAVTAREALQTQVGAMNREPQPVAHQPGLKSPALKRERTVNVPTPGI